MSDKINDLSRTVANLYDNLDAAFAQLRAEREKITDAGTIQELKEVWQQHKRLWEEVNALYRAASNYRARLQSKEYQLQDIVNITNDVWGGAGPDGQLREDGREKERSERWLKNGN